MKKTIKSMMKTRLSGTIPYTYQDIDSFDEIKDRFVKGVHGFCFCGDKLVVVWSDKKGYWTPPGGGVEKGESALDALYREIKEETNMRVVKHKFIGFIEVPTVDKDKIQTRSVCIVEPYGPFVCDPDGDIDRIKLIDLKDVKKYFDWGEVGDYMLERTSEILKELN